MQDNEFQNDGHSAAPRLGTRGPSLTEGPVQLLFVIKLALQFHFLFTAAEIEITFER